MELLKLTVLLILMVAETTQQDPSVNCVQDNTPVLGFFYPSQYRTQRLKCTFSNIANTDQMKKLLNSENISPTNAVIITFNNSNLASLHDRAFSIYSNLRSLEGSNLRLTEISSNAFSGIKTLESLTLSFNNLTALSSKVFGMLKLKLLDLSYNLISSIDENAFLGSEIDKIDLSFNKLKTTKFINGFKFFNYMQMSYNEIEKFDSIDITSGAWGVPRDLYILPQFPSINLQNNKIESFDCSSTIKISLVDLTNNRQLSDVKLNKCEITRLDVSDCGSLKSIKLTDNLSDFTAKNVKFEQIEFGEKNSLQSLILVNNSLSVETIASISKLENLTYLELNYNTIGPLNISTFAKLKKLETLKLKATKISNINFGTFSHQNNIREFDISDNDLGNFDMNMIYTMNSLTYLDISGNSLTELTNLDLAHLTFTILEKIDLTKNKWSCKYLMRLMRVMKTYRVTLVNSNIEEHQSNINGVYCVHNEGEDNVLATLDENSNLTDFRQKLNEVIRGLESVRDSVATLKSQADNRVNAQPQRAENSIGELQVKNSSLLDFSLIIVCACFTVFMALQVFAVFKRNFINRPRPIRGMSENILNMNEDY